MAFSRCACRKETHESVGGELDLGVNVTSLLLGVVDGDVDQLGVSWLLGSSKDKGRVGGGILWLVGVDGWRKSDEVLQSASVSQHADDRCEIE